MRRFGIPVLPLIVGVIMGPLIELQGRRALQLSCGDPKGLFGGVDVATGQFAGLGLAVVGVPHHPDRPHLASVLFWLIKKLLPARAGAAVEHLSEELHHDLDTDHDGHPLATSHASEIKLPVVQSSQSSPKENP